MAGGKHQHQHQHQQGMVVKAEPGVARRLWRVVRAVLYMLRRGVPSSGRKLAADLHLLLRRGKIAGKALGDLLLHHHGHGHGRGAFPYASAGSSSSSASSFSCRALDPGLSVHEPTSRARREVEFSCSNTPSSAAGGGGFRLLGAAKRRRRRRGESGYMQQPQPQQQHCYYDYDAAEVARVFEMLSDDDVCGDHARLFIGAEAADDDFEFEFEPAASASASAGPSATPSPARLLWALARSPAVAVAAAAAVAKGGGGSRKPPPPRVPEYYSPARGADEGVDRQADEFIRRFYEQLRAQRSAASTPDYYGHGATATATASPYAVGTGAGRTPWAVVLAAGIA